MLCNKSFTGHLIDYKNILFAIFCVLLLAGYHRVDGYVDFETVNKLPIRIGNECDTRVANDHEFETCRRRAFQDWNTYDMTQRIRYDCCYQWDVIDCEEKSVYNLCDQFEYDDDYKTYKQRKREHIDYFERYQCSDYTYYGANCRFPIWAIVLIVVGGVILLLLLGGICFYVRRRSKRQRERMEEE